jgi:uncharacterized RDD family membrane protein YckC
LGYGFATLLLPLVAYLERDWKFMHLYLGLFALIAGPILAFFLQESGKLMHKVRVVTR